MATKNKQAYYDCVKATLQAALCVQNFPSMKVECHNKPEIEMPSAKEAVLTPVVVSRAPQKGMGNIVVEEKVKIEPSINSCRISIKILQMDKMASVLVDRFMRFLMTRAEKFQILRRNPVEGYDISFLITNFHTEQYLRDELIDFIISFMSNVDSEVSKLKQEVNSRARTVATQILKSYAV